MNDEVIAHIFEKKTISAPSWIESSVTDKLNTTGASWLFQI
jgi:hypothetical protein